MVHGVETEPSQRLTRQLFVNTTLTSPGPSPAGVKDKMLTDLGMFQLATEGIPVSKAPTIIGELWVSYKVKLSRAALTDILQHRDLEVQCLETIFESSVANHSVPHSLSTYEGSTLQLDTRLDAISLHVDFPTSIQNGVYRIHVILSGETFDSSGEANIVPSLTATNCAVLTSANQQSAWTIGSAINAVPGTLSSVFDEDTVVTSMNNHPMSVGYVRMDHATRDPTKPAQLELRVLMFNAPPTSTVSTRMRVLISECNEEEALSIRSQANNTDFQPWGAVDPLHATA